METRKKKRIRKIKQGKETVLNLSSRKLTQTDYILLGKGLKFCPKPKSNDKIKLAEETYNFATRLRLKEYFYENNDKSEHKEFKQMPFFNKRKSTFIPPNGRDTYLDFYI
jgi:hypothetical protein